MKSVEKNENGDWAFKPEYRLGAWRERTDYQGYWNTSLCQLSGGKNPLIAKRSDGRYEVTTYGWSKRLHPFAKDEKELKRMREFRAERKARFERDEYRLIKKVVVQ